MPTSSPPQDVPPGAAAQGSLPPDDVDVLVIGSGFGGSVTALRLTEKGYRVAVLEAGRRFADEDFPGPPGGCATTSSPRASAAVESCG